MQGIQKGPLGTNGSLCGAKQGCPPGSGFRVWGLAGVLMHLTDNVATGVSGC